MLLENVVCSFLEARKAFVQELVIWNVAASIAVQLMFVRILFFKDFVGILKTVYICIQRVTLTSLGTTLVEETSLLYFYMKIQFLGKIKVTVSRIKIFHYFVKLQQK